MVANMSRAGPSFRGVSAMIGADVAPAVTVAAREGCHSHSFLMG